MCIHHPSLDIKKISQSSKPLYTVIYGAQAWRADWFVGGACTEPGSSGSPLFDSNRRIIGQEYGGGSYCEAPSSYMFDVYGRFDISWEGTSSENSLKDWLDPLGLDPETWDGRYSAPIVDAELMDVVVPREEYYSVETIEPTITVKNSGNVVITSATVSYTIDGGAAVSKTWTGNLAGGATVDITFDSITLTYGTHVFKAIVTIDEDSNPENDEKTKSFEVSDCFLNGVLLQEDFEENGDLPACWQNMAISGTAAWEFVTDGNNGEGNPENPQSGSYNAHFQSNKFGHIARLITPPMNLIDASMPQPVLTFWHAHAKCNSKQDGLRIYYKNALDASWIQITSFTDDVSSWKEENILLPEPSEMYWIAFEGLSGGGSGVVLDNISIVPALGLDEMQNNSIKIYPNPTRGELIIDNGQWTIDNVEIFDVMGKSVYSSTCPPVHPSTIDISHLPVGVYFVRIQIENGQTVTKQITIIP
jgi:hypothetical protein